jgi:hypothetical protein
VVPNKDVEDDDDINDNIDDDVTGFAYDDDCD